MRRSLTFALIVALVGAFALAGCTQKPTTPTSTAKTGTVQVDMKNFAFAPKEVTIKKGATIKWVNMDSQPHDATGEGKSWQSEGGDGGMTKDEMWEHVFDTVGTFKYYCTVHSSGPGNGMSGTITVVA